MSARDEVTMLLGKATSEHLCIDFLRQTYTPTDDDYSDANWLSVRVRVRVGGFDGRAEGVVTAAEVMGFRDQLRRLHATLQGEAAFETLEAWVSLRLLGDGLGHIDAHGFLLDAPGVGNRLEFSLKLDQTDLPAVLAGLDDACRMYPVLDKP